MVAISKHTLKSLRILDHDRHPSLMGIGVRKEGFSVLTLLDRCVTAKVWQRPTFVALEHAATAGMLHYYCSACFLAQ
jgi:hypothetical protein